MQDVTAPVLILTGLTGSGKSEWAMRLSRQWPVEIITVDSAQVFRGMDIGTAKPDKAARAAVVHHLLDILDPMQTYSAGQFAQDAVTLIGQIRTRGSQIGGYFRLQVRFTFKLAGQSVNGLGAAGFIPSFANFGQPRVSCVHLGLEIAGQIRLRFRIYRSA